MTTREGRRVQAAAHIRGRRGHDGMMPVTGLSKDGRTVAAVPARQRKTTLAATASGAARWRGCSPPFTADWDGLQ